MSTKATMILTLQNEHWHRELCAKYNYGIDTKGDECMVLEFSSEHIIEMEDDGDFSVIVKPGSELFKALNSARFDDGWD